MKYLKMLGLAAVAAMALMAFVGAGSASASMLYSTSGGVATTIPAGAVLDASLTAGQTAKLEDTNTNVLDTCSSGTVKGSVTGAGSSTTTVTGSVAAGELTWGKTGTECTNTTDTLEGGELEIHSISGTTNGTLTAKGFKVTVLTLGVTCIYTAGGGTDLGTLTGSKGGTAVMDVNAVVNKTTGSSFLCPTTGIWNASYTVTSVTYNGNTYTDLYVEES